MDKETMKEILGVVVNEDNKKSFQGLGIAIRAKRKSPRDSVGMETLALAFEELSGDIDPAAPTPEKKAVKKKAAKKKQPVEKPAE